MPRARPAPSGLGIEDELSFGSDEDLIAEVGELSLPPIDTINPNVIASSSSTTNLPSSHVSNKTKSSGGGMFKSLGGKKEKSTVDLKEKRKRNDTGETIKLAPSLPTSLTKPPTQPGSGLGSGSFNNNKKDKLSNKTLAKSSLVIDPALVESVLDVTTSASRNTNSTQIHNLSSTSATNKSRNSLSISSSSKSPSITSSSQTKNDIVSLSAVGGKKKGFMSSLRGLSGKNNNKKEDPFSVFGIQSNINNNGNSNGMGNRGSIGSNRPDLASLRGRDSFGGKSDISRQQSIDIASSTLSTPRTDSSDHSLQKNTLAPISMSPFQGHTLDLTPDSTTIRSSISNSSKRPSISSFARRASVMTSTSFATSELAGEESPILSKAVLHKFPIMDDEPLTPHDIRITSDKNESNQRPSAPIAIPSSPMLSADISSVLLPSFPASLSSLSSIQILQATVIRKTFPNSTNGGMPDKEKSNSIRSLTNALTSNGNSNNSQKPIWITQQLVLTSFKVGGTTPQSTPDPNNYLSSSTSSSKTIANLHLFSIPGSSTTSSRGNKGSIGLGIGSSHNFSRRPSLSSNALIEEIELERKPITNDCTAGVWNNDENGRKFVMRIGFDNDDYNQQNQGENEWIVEMRNPDQKQEWIRQIKSIATVIRAEREGHGRAIHNAYSDSVRGDELALELDLQRSASPIIKSPVSRSTSISVPSVVSGQRESTFSDIPVQETLMERNTSAARAESPNMLPPTPQIDDLNGRLGNLELGREILPRSKSLSRGHGNLPQPQNETTPVSTPSSSRAGSIVPGSAGGPISRIGGSLHRHAKQGSWSSSASGASSNFVGRRYGSIPPPPPPMAPPPNLPLPALPSESDEISSPIGSKSKSPFNDETNEEGLIRSPGGIEFTTPFQSPALKSDPTINDTPTSGHIYSSTEEPRLSLPSPEDESILRLRQSTRSTSLPSSSPPIDENEKLILAARARKASLLNAFKPIPLVPEITTSPKLGYPSPVLGDSRTSSPLINGTSSPNLTQEIIRPPTPPRKTLQNSTSTQTSNREIKDEFYTPTSTSISSFPMSLPPSQSTSGGDGDTIETSSILSTPSTINESIIRPENKRYTSSINSFTPSVESRSTTASSSRRRREKRVAVDIMSEFNETPGAAYDVDGDEEIKEDRPRVIRFA